MNNQSNVIRALLIVVLLAAPAVLVRIYSMYSDNPYLQPLALTKKGVDGFENSPGAKGPAQIEIDVHWGRASRGQLTPERLSSLLTTTLQHQTQRYRIAFHDQPGTDVKVTFAVGPNRYGPFPPGRMIDGLNSALIALRMTNRPQG